MVSRSGFSLQTPFDQCLLVPLTRGKHVRTVVNAQDCHLISVLKILQQLGIEKNKYKNFILLKIISRSIFFSYTIQSFLPSSILSAQKDTKTHFGCDKEILGRRLFAGSTHHDIKHSPLVDRIHSLHTEGNEEVI